MRPVLAADTLSWTFVPNVAAGLCASALAYAALLARRWRVRHRIAWRRLIAWFAGLAVIAIAVMSPLDSLADDRSFAAHMVQHELLLTVAPLLLLMGLDAQLLAPLTWWIIRPALRRKGTKQALRAVTAPSLALVLWSASVLVWSAPAMVALAYRNETVHNVEHLQFVVVGLLFWAVILAPFPSLHRPNLARKLTYLGIVCVVGALVAAVLAFDPSILYRVPYGAGRPWLGLSALAEQHLAAAAMMAIDMPAALAAAVWVVSRGRITSTPSTDEHPSHQPQVTLGLSPLLGGPNPH
jgi:cytochrome c oxidase assembly factor CtaG